jgi:hypothetical protein
MTGLPFPDGPRALGERLAEGGEAAVRAVVDGVREDPNRVHGVLGLLTCGREAAEDGAAAVVRALAQEAPERLEPVRRRLVRVAGAVERPPLRLALAEALPRLALGRWEAGRLALVLEGWLDDGDEAVKRAAMSAMVALVPQRPVLADRVRQVIERRAAAGSPAAARHGRALLETLRTF